MNILDKLQKPIVATLLSTFFASIAFQVMAYLHLRYLDPFFIIAFGLSLGITFLISLLVGIPFIRYRRFGVVLGTGHVNRL